MATLFSTFWAFLTAIFTGKKALILENFALRQQLAVYLRKEKRPRLRPCDRVFWVLLSKPKQGQRWRQFIDNHKGEIFACDFLTQYTAFFSVVYIFVIMELESRRIVHFNVSESPGFDWIKQQIREISPYGQGPRFLIHDNDGIYGQFGSRKSRKDGGSYRCSLDIWLDKTMGIEGIPIPYGAPNANARLERFNRTLREEALNHFISSRDNHIRRVCSVYSVRPLLNFRLS